MFSALDSGASGLGLSTGRGHYVVFLGKTLISQYLFTPKFRPDGTLGSYADFTFIFHLGRGITTATHYERHELFLLG